MTPGTAATDTLMLRGATFALLARLLGPDARSVDDGDDLEALRVALGRLGDAAAISALIPLGSPRPEEGRHTTWSRLFEQGRASPYEMSYLRPGLGGHTARIADVAGFYNAFGFRVPQDRPDHFVAELEFAAFLTLGEAHAHEVGDHDGEAVFGDACATFLSDHLGGWLDLLADRVHEDDPAGPFGPLAAGASAFIDAECGRRQVTAVRPERVDTPGLGADEDTEENLLPRCGECPAFTGARPRP